MIIISKIWNFIVKEPNSKIWRLMRRSVTSSTRSTRRWLNWLNCRITVHQPERSVSLINGLHQVTFCHLQQAGIPWVYSSTHIGSSTRRTMKLKPAQENANKYKSVNTALYFTDRITGALYRPMYRVNRQYSKQLTNGSRAVEHTVSVTVWTDSYTTWQRPIPCWI
jgi:hypothetical protein